MNLLHDELAAEREGNAKDAERLRKLIPGCDCDNPAQCWEPCGTLGHHEEHAKVAPDSARKGEG